MCGTCGCSGAAVVRLITADERGGAHEHAAPRRGGPRSGQQHGPHHHGPAELGQHAADQPGHGPHEPEPEPEPEPEHEHEHEHGHGHGHGQDDDQPQSEGQLIDGRGDSGRTVMLQQKVLAKNDALAQANRDWLAGRSILAVNLMSSPGAGKTTLLEQTAAQLTSRVRISVIEGDQETALDASRIKAAGCKVVQINTGAGCHLDAEMVGRGLRVLDPPSGSIVMIENVGNLVCPALFDLGEQARVVLASVAEGADKPVKYPHMFRQAHLVLVTKIDLLPYVDFDIHRYASDLRKVSPGALMMQVSAVTGQGMDAWYDWLGRRIPAPSD